MSERVQKRKQMEGKRFVLFRVFYFGNQLNITASSSISGSKQTQHLYKSELGGIFLFMVIKFTVAYFSIFKDLPTVVY